MPTQFGIIPSKNEELNRVQQNLRLAIDPLSKDVLLNRVTIDIDITKPPLLAETSKTFQHNLGREPRGWIVVDKNINADIWRKDWDKNTITFSVSATVKASILLF